MWCPFAVQTFISNDQSRTHTRFLGVEGELRAPPAGPGCCFLHSPVGSPRELAALVRSERGGDGGEYGADQPLGAARRCGGGSGEILKFEGLRDWCRLLQPNGHVALTEVCWRKREPPAECAEFWHREYPAIRDTSALLEAIEACGYETLGHFPLPASAWWDDYYRPLQDNVSGFRKRHHAVPDAQKLADECQREMDIWSDYSEFYGYEFCVLRAR